MRLPVSPLWALIGLTCTVSSQQTIHQQCGGIGWAGGTKCVDGTVCQELNSYYYQCLADTTSSISISTTHSSTPTSHSLSSISPTVSSSSSSASSTATMTNVSPQWAAAYVKAKALLTKLSLEDKVNLTTGVGWQNGNCVGNIPSIPSINFPGLCLEDSPLGVRYADEVSAFPAAINLAATFNRTLINQRGIALGQEFYGKGVNVALGPMMNLMRAPAAGRNWEGFGGDPFLSGEGAFETITGIQSTGVQAVAKHYINNEQEHFRSQSSSIVDDRTQHELYAAPFLRSVMANVASVMCSYNQINGSFACENDKTLNGILKGEFGFQGYVMSDWSATHSTGSANAGLDQTMPGDITLGSGGSYFGQALINAVNSGNITQARVDDMATRILAAWYLLGQDENYPPVNFDAWNLNTPVNTHVNVQGNHASLIRSIGAASTVLLKNSKDTLPLYNPKSIGVIGNGAGNSSKGPNGYTDRGGDDGVLAMGWGSGTANFPYLIAPVDALTARAKTTGTIVVSSLNDTDLTAAVSAATGRDVAFVFVTADSGEGYITVEGNFGDRNDLNAWHSGDTLIQEVASVNNNTIVVVNSVGPIILEQWIDNPNVTALIWSGIPGQEAGNAFVDIIYGTYNPSGRLPYTIGKNISDYSAQVVYTSNDDILPIPYSEGIFIDYRHFDMAGIAPRFEFGFGLSYTTFKYSHLSISGSVAGGSPPTGPGSSLDPWLHDKAVNVTFTITNNGTVAGHEVPQLYTSPPPSANAAPFNLKGFDNIFLSPGESQVVTITLSRYDLSFWNVIGQHWEIPSGTTGISVAASSRDIRLKGSIVN